MRYARIEMIPGAGAVEVVRQLHAHDQVVAEELAGTFPVGSYTSDKRCEAANLEGFVVLPETTPST